MKRFDCLGAMIENEYGPYCYATHADLEIDKAREKGRTAYVSLLPADWFDDASLETWFPLTAQSMRELREAHDAAVISKSELEGYLRAVIEHIAPMLKLYEPNLPEHPVIQSIREYLSK